MKILGQVAVYPAPGERIHRLAELARNLWWSWQPAAVSLFAELDPGLWEQSGHNPVKLLRIISQERLDRVARDQRYLTRYDAVLADFDRYMGSTDTWYARTYGSDDRLVAYFSAEFGLHESLPIYSGGLGILSGDHCKTASDLGLPLVGMGFLYPQGYFRQQIDAEGCQQATYEKLDFAEVPALPALDPDGRQIVISVELPGRAVYAKLWRIQVGRVAVYLMDTDLERNAPADRELSARLYGGDQEVRISQEIVLGIGGVRALRALGLAPTIWHMNEGHAAFLQLERLREYVEVERLPFFVALWSARADALFTTHTPVPAGNDAFPFELIDRFFSGFWGKLGLTRERFMALGRTDSPWGAQFSMTVLALGTAGMANGVSALHGQVSRRMWRGLWPDTPIPEVPIEHITNGVHTDTWLHAGLAALLDRYLAPGWRDGLERPSSWAGVAQIPDGELWAQHRAAKETMLDDVRRRVARQLRRVGAPPGDVSAALRVLDPDALTFGFARRFATYKRSTLLFRNLQRLRRILLQPNRPVQFIFAGKAHPADEPGKALIQAIYRLSRQPEFAGRIVFVEDYDASLARSLVAGVDLWLNTPRRPLEASGTSGQKAGLNGVPNFSVLDGWWAEGFDGSNGWSIGQATDYADEPTQDEADALSLYETIEEQIVPLFYDRDANGVPGKWLAKARASIMTVGPAFSFDRVLKEYVDRFYIIASDRGKRLLAEEFAGASALAQWEDRILAAWSEVRITASGPTTGESSVDKSLRVEALVDSASLAPGDLAVELVYGRKGKEDLVDARVLPMRLVGGEGAVHRYEVELAFRESGVFAYGVRVRPCHEDLPNPFALHLVRWA